jgi:hypothetical protein
MAGVLAEHHRDLHDVERRIAQPAESDRALAKVIARDARSRVAEAPEPVTHRSVVDPLWLRLDLERAQVDAVLAAGGEHVADELIVDGHGPGVDRVPGHVQAGGVPPGDLARRRPRHEQHEVRREAAGGASFTNGTA